MLPDQIDLLSAFNAHGVEYVVVGGHAVNAYCTPRFTKDLDVLVRSTEVNSHAVFRALAAYGAPMQGVTPEDFRDPNSFFQLGVEPNRIDIMQQIPALTFEEVRSRAFEGVVEGVAVPYISREDLIASKLACGRPGDLADVHQLRKTQNTKQK